MAIYTGEYKASKGSQEMRRLAAALVKSQGGKLDGVNLNWSSRKKKYNDRYRKAYSDAIMGGIDSNSYSDADNAARSWLGLEQNTRPVKTGYATYSKGTPKYYKAPSVSESRMDDAMRAAIEQGPSKEDRYGKYGSYEDMVKATSQHAEGSDGYLDQLADAGAKRTYQNSQESRRRRNQAGYSAKVKALRTGTSGQVTANHNPYGE